MKKKEIEKIPFRGGVRADKQYRNTAVVFLQDIRGESHLFVEVYENKKRELQTPWIRMVFTQKDWGLYYPDARVWSAAGLDEEREKIDSNCKKRDNRCYMARSQGDMVWKFTGDTWERKYTTWVGALQSLIYNIKAQRVQKREDKRADRLKEREQNTPPLPKGLEDWAKKTGIGTEHFLYYKHHGRYADITCSACGQVTEAAVRRKDTYEGQFEKIIPVPQHNSVGTCPHCGAAGVYKAQGKVKGVWGHVFIIRYVGHEYLHWPELCHVRKDHRILPEKCSVLVEADASIKRIFHHGSQGRQPSNHPKRRKTPETGI